MANPSAPDPDVVAEAYRLTLEPPRGEGLSYAQVALRLGISKPTVGRYVQLAIAHVPHIELHRRAEEQGDMTRRLRAMLYATYALAEKRYPDPDDEDADDGPWLALMDFAAKREAQLATLLGLNSPAKLDITTNGRGGNGDAPVDGALIAALAKLEARNEADDRELRAGRPGVIEGGSTT